MLLELRCVSCGDSDRRRWLWWWWWCCCVPVGVSLCVRVWEEGGSMEQVCAACWLILSLHHRGQSQRDTEGERDLDKHLTPFCGKKRRREHWGRERESDREGQRIKGEISHHYKGISRITPPPWSGFMLYHWVCCLIPGSLFQLTHKPNCGGPPSVLLLLPLVQNKGQNPAIGCCISLIC